jgi:putative membrane protein
VLRLIKFIFLLAMAVLGAGFASINPEVATIHYYFGDLSLPMGMLLLGMLGLGMLLGLLASVFMLLKTRRENARLHRKAELVNTEVNNLRTIPLKNR